MKKQATVIALAAALTAVLTGSSFAQGARHPVRNVRPAVISGYSGYYNSAVPEGSYTGYDDDATGGLSADLGALGN